MFSCLTTKRAAARWEVGCRLSRRVIRELPDSHSQIHCSNTQRNFLFRPAFGSSHLLLDTSQKSQRTRRVPSKSSKPSSCSGAMPEVRHHA